MMTKIIAFLIVLLTFIPPIHALDGKDPPLEDLSHHQGTLHLQENKKDKKYSTPPMVKGCIKGSEMTGRGILGICGGTVGAAGGVIFGIGLATYLAWTTNCGSKKNCAVDGKMLPLTPIIFAMDGAQKGFLLFWK